MIELSSKLATIAERAFILSIEPDKKNAFYDIRVERSGIAIEAKWGKSMNYRHITVWRELDVNVGVLDYAFDLVKKIVENHND